MIYLFFLVIWILFGWYWLYRIKYEGWIESKGINRIIDTIIMFPFLILLGIIIHIAIL